MRRRGEERTSHAIGTGDWVLDEDTEDPDPAPVTTIAWRLQHLHWSFAGRCEWTFGQRRRRPADLVRATVSASLALERLNTVLDSWRAGIGALTEEQLDTTGFGQFPHGSDPDVPFAVIVAWTNYEFTHHMAEVALLRDLWRHRG
ncbi:DinB family protein [Amycolatopsis antarctica]|uniref:DinB family protein n=1 Tax=Amycolatopsis antarctica TaxID=1854586 RepID=UPI001F0B3821|nr:DinB family protein [Amycolatopsis antarctica]